MVWDHNNKSNMIFGHSLFFCNEISLNEFNMRSNTHLDTFIYVIENETLSLTNRFPYCSERGTLSGQEIYYYSEKPFHKYNKPFSWGLEIKDTLSLVWNTNHQEIIYCKGVNYTSKKLRFWIYHTFLPLIIELENKYCMMHVGAVEVEGKPILFSALSYGGKSTLIDYFLKKGHTLLSDDSLAIDEEDNVFYVVPSYPYYRPYRKLESLGYYTENFTTKQKPIYILYTLKKVTGDSDIVITELKGIEKFKALHKSIFIDFYFMKKKHFEFLTEMAKNIFIFEITVPWDMERLEEVYEAICTHTNSLK